MQVRSSISSSIPANVLVFQPERVFVQCWQGYSHDAKGDKDGVYRDELQKNYLAQAAEALGEEPAAADVPRTSSPSTSTDVNEPRAARATLGDGLVDSPLKASLPAVFSPPRLVDESMSGGEPNTPEPNAISLNQPIPIASSHSDTVPPPEETEMKTFGMSTSVRMEQAFPGISDFGDKGIASDIADLSDAGEAPPSGVRHIMILLAVNISVSLVNACKYSFL